MKKIIALMLSLAICIAMLSGCNSDVTEDVQSDISTTEKTSDVSVEKECRPVKILSARYIYAKSLLLGQDNNSMLLSFENVLPDKDIIKTSFTLIVKDERGNEIVNSETLDKYYYFYYDEPMQAGKVGFCTIAPTGFDLGTTYDLYVSNVLFSDGTDWEADENELPAVSIVRNFLGTGEETDKPVSESILNLHNSLLLNLKEGGLDYSPITPVLTPHSYDFYYSDFSVSYSIDDNENFKDYVTLEYQESPSSIFIEDRMELLSDEEQKIFQNKVQIYYKALLKTVFPDLTDEEVLKLIEDKDLEGYDITIIENPSKCDKKTKIVIGKK